jgi:hypothetical protein
MGEADSFLAAREKTMKMQKPRRLLHKLQSYADRIVGRQRPFLMFDAGGTIVFPNVNLMIKLLARRGWRMSLDHLYEGYYKVIHKWHGMVAKQDAPIHFFPKGHADELFDELCILDPNTGRLARFFNHIFDSKDLKFEKPNPRIFTLALEQLKLKPAQVIYIGDLYEVDVKGANAAGIGSIHLDPLEKYPGWSGVHIHNVSELPGWLKEHKGKALEVEQLHPFSLSTAPTKSEQAGKTVLSHRPAN